MALLRHAGMSRVFARAYAPSTLGSFLRAFTFGHVRQLDAIASRFLIALADLTRLLGAATTVNDDSAADRAGYALLDVDDTIIEVHGHAKQGAGFGYSGVRGLNALLATLAVPLAGATTAPVIVAQRLRKGTSGSPRGAKRLVGDAVRTARRLLGKDNLAPATIPPISEVTFAPAFAPLSVGTLRCSSARSRRPADSASASTGTRPPADTRFGSSNATDVRPRV
jgi:hypothetical protein